MESLSAEAHNLWTNTQLSDPASRPSQDYRKKFLEYLGYKTKKDRKRCPCMLTGVVGNSNQVVVAQLAPATSKLNNLEVIGLID